VSGLLLAGTSLALTAPLLLAPGAVPGPTSDAELALGAAGWLGVLAVLWAAGVTRRTKRVRREDRAGQDLRRVVEQERYRIARELHDVVAQLVSAVAVQAGAARAVADTIRGPSTGSPGTSRSTASASGPPCRTSWRCPGRRTWSPWTRSGSSTSSHPLRSAGLPVAAAVHGEPDVDGQGETALFARRILVEALTNVLRHAGPSPTRVSIAHTPDEVVVEVVDSGRVPADRNAAGSPDGAGLGLVGMRERAALLGGTVDAGPDPGGGWRVVARLPQHQLATAPT
jgi:signal transduction histidine kinase